MLKGNIVNKEKLIKGVKVVESTGVQPVESVDNLAEEPKNVKDKVFIIVTQDMSGAGFAKMCVDAGYETIIAVKPKEDEEHVEELMSVMSGIVPVVELDELLKKKEDYRESYFLWDFNHNWEISEQLRSEGFKVFGGLEISDKMEHDRAFGTSIVEQAGIMTPPTFEFSDIDKGLEFLDQNMDKAYVFKPDESGEGCFTTYVPDSVRPEKANRELYSYMSSQNGESGTYILQERKDGVEANFELWLYEGQPILGYGNFECKRKLNHDEGEMVGCSQDMGFIIPINCKGIELTVAKLLPQYQDYTGFLDMNVIIADNEIYFIEFCARFGYAAHPNVFTNLARKPFPEIMVDWIDGNIEKFQDNFKYGFGASVTLYIDHKRSGYPLYVEKEMCDKFYHYDSKKEDNDEEHEYTLAGYAHEVGVVCAHAYTIEDAAKQCIRNVDKVTYPNHACRTDLDLCNYETSPSKRYTALNAMKMFI